MAGQVTKLSVLSTYKKLLRESQKFESYNFRNYAFRRIRDSFKSNKSLHDPKEVQAQMDFAKKNIDIIQRQVIVGKLYSSEKLIIEK